MENFKNSVGFWWLGALLFVAFLFITPFESTEDLETDNCLVADNIQFIDSHIIDGKKYKLVVRVSGFQDKVIFIELYQSQNLGNDVEFDSCGRTKQYLVDSQSISDHAFPVEFVVSDSNFEMIYKADKRAVPIVNLPVSWKVR